ncbi:MAG: hypothetical protein JNM09_29530 [Blastocatellia bacterium]|nr:hypothetical protein [Blastocatellia bacterium]
MKMALLALLIALVLLPIQVLPAAQKTVVTAAQVNGTWSSKRGTIRVWALGKQRLRVEFYGLYEYNIPGGSIANLGEARGIAEIEGDTAILKPDERENRCTIKLQFVGPRLIVSQDGECGFGKHVTSAGEYRKTSSRKPRFGTEPRS